MLPNAEMEAMIKKMKRSKVNQIRKQVAMCEDKYRKRYQAEGPESTERKSINVAIGAWEDIELTKAQSAMEEMGMEAEIKRVMDR